MNFLKDDFGIFTTQKEVEQCTTKGLVSTMYFRKTELTWRSPWIEHSILCASYPNP
jgi:hypothetical protein